MHGCPWPKPNRSHVDILPTVHSVTAAEAFQGIPIVDMFLKAELGSSKGEVRRLIKGGGARLNDAKVQDEGQIVLGSDYVDGEVKLSAGKKKHAIIEQV